MMPAPCRAVVVIRPRPRRNLPGDGGDRHGHRAVWLTLARETLQRSATRRVKARHLLGEVAERDITVFADKLLHLMARSAARGSRRARTRARRNQSCPRAGVEAARSCEGAP